MPSTASDQSAVTHLRAATRADHAAVDGAFGRFAIGTREGYRDFLQAHARILPLAERLIQPGALIQNWSGRTAALLEDLKSMGGDAPAELDFALPDGDAARWGALYVIEGSRLGGAVLAKMVPEDLPVAYLSARHPQGAWRALLERLDEADSGVAWRQAAEHGAKRMFNAYLTAAKLR